MSLRRPQPFRVPEFERLLTTAWLGRPLEYHRQLGSSNDRALELARGGGAHGTVIVADVQTSARGRHGRSWQCAPEEGVWATALLRPRRQPSELPQIPLLVGLALCEALADDLGVMGLSLRWPNDLDLNGRKVAGILCERASSSEGEAVVVGFGINCAPGAVPSGLQGGATSLAGEGHELDREAVLAAGLKRIELRYEQWDRQGFAVLREAYLARMSLAGRTVKLIQAQSEVVGEVETVDSAGALVLRTAEGRRSYHAGEVERVR